MMKRRWLIVGAMVLAGVGAARAHLVNESLILAGGGPFTVGTPVKITWDVSNLHDGKMNIDLSMDGGAKWTTIKAYTASAPGIQTFNWTPDAATTQGKIRICQTAEKPACTDAQNTSRPDDEAPYTLVTTSSFTVTASSGIHSFANAMGFSIDFRPNTRNVNVSFGLATDQDVSLLAFDAQGHLIATLLEGKQSTGVHRMSVYSNRLDATSGILVFKLKAGDEVRTQSVNVAR
ncbi:MAG TPA: hypothetical protein VJ385_16365 [Fibrobacteria bacterium]|nr:hypothetical protein [Fibrobacteria bacterium]